MRRIIIAVASVIVVLLAVGFWQFRDRFDNGTLRISISQKQIDETLAKKFPRKKKHLKVFEVTYHNPRCELLAGTERVRIAIDVTLTAGAGLVPLEKKYHGHAMITCGIGYDPAEHRILLKDAVFIKIELPKVKEEYLAMLETTASLAAAEFFDTIPVYQIKDRKPSEALAKMIMKKITIADQKLDLVIGL